VEEQKRICHGDVSANPHLGKTRKEGFKEQERMFTLITSVLVGRGGNKCERGTDLDPDL